MSDVVQRLCLEVSIIEAGREGIRRDGHFRKVAPVTLEQLLRILRYEPATGHFYWLIHTKGRGGAICPGDPTSVDAEIPPIFIGYAENIQSPSIGVALHDGNFSAIRYGCRAPRCRPAQQSMG